MSDLARRAVACKGWRWMPRMLAVCTVIKGARGIILDVADDEGRVLMCDADPATLQSTRCRITAQYYEPDLDDPATLGCLLALVREAWGPTCSVIHVLDGDGWALCTSGGALGLPDLKSGRGTQFYRTYAEGLVAALEAAP